MDERRASRILARSLTRRMLAEGYAPREIVAVSTALLDEVSKHLADRRASRERPAPSPGQAAR